MQGIFTKVLNLWIPQKTDKGTVVTDVFEPNFTKIDQYAENTNVTLKNLESNKLNKGTYTGDASDLNAEISKIASPTQLGRVKVGNNLKIDENGFLNGQDVDLSNYYDKPEIEEKFKNFCPFPINSVFLTLGGENPHTLWLGTTWEKQEGRFLLGSSFAYALGSTGGNSTIILTEANMPRHRHQVDTVSATIPEHTHPYKIGGGNYGGPGNSEGGLGGSKYTGNTLPAGGGSTGVIAPYTSYVGSGTAFNNMPPYLVVNIWKRLT